ncbi:aminotransferase class I/II-fold pyridoxal phosphate-dependent enzyme [Jeongeupia chitinilytica]|uniref:Putative 8-amino-7-oxononanoate synthase n=1 Tax=Jeongeupia chitinilytica TaxID=1041641 RepID=A0ABQ3H1V7_9NEIS|nr:aminotransferase class I/II-fold pyridoxal phosphate-dependent enzyme [Jeongeupia chitinilytica]GHD66034.1 GntR family transcriptional regulator [Jeongeupia chitinilytica]
MLEGSTALEIVASIDRMIRFEQWKAGHQLPSVRVLAGQLGVNPNTVASAYKMLRDAGTIVTDGRRGTHVAGDVEHSAIEMAVPAGLRDLASGNVDGRLLPRLNPDWLATPVSLASYDAGEDDPALITLAQRWMFEPAGCNGPVAVFSSVLDAIERALLQRCRPGMKVLVEDPCWPPLLALLISMRLKPVPLPVDAHGAQVPSAALLQESCAVILTARAHNPTGVSYSRERWQAWQFALARSADSLLIIDDHWGALSAVAPPPLQIFSCEWVYVLSVSKFLGPELRLAVAAGNGPVLKTMLRRHTFAPRWVSPLLQRIVARAWQGMLDDNALATVRDAYATRRATLQASLLRHGVGVIEHGEGLHLWVPVDNETTIVQHLASLGWAVQAGQPFRLASPPAIRISIGNLALTDLDTLAADLARALVPRTRAIY